MIIGGDRRGRTLAGDIPDRSESSAIRPGGRRREFASGNRIGGGFDGVRYNGVGATTAVRPERCAYELQYDVTGSLVPDVRETREMGTSGSNGDVLDERRRREVGMERPVRAVFVATVCGYVFEESDVRALGERSEDVSNRRFTRKGKTVCK